MSRFNRSSMLQPGEKVSEEQLAAEAKHLAFERSVALMDRRNFIAGLATAGAAAAGTLGLAGCSDNGPATVVVTGPPNVVEVLNFALNLEYLEASFYLYTSSGAGIPASNQLTGAGTVTGGAAINFTIPEVKAAAAQLAANELAHVQLLQSTITSLGGTPVPMPSINLAANGSVTTDALFLAAARQFEGVGVSAYAGGAQYLTSNTGVLTAASQILHLEAQHSGFLRLLCIANGVTSAAVDSLDTQPSLSAPFNTSPSTGYVPARTTSQVLQIVYAAPGQSGVTKGGFFPNGMNGFIVST